jgi:hypothetical protein
MAGQTIKTDILKKNMIEALIKTMGVVSAAARKVHKNPIEAEGLRKIHYEWMINDEVYNKNVNDIKNISLDFAESKLHQSINNGSDTATIFFLKTQGKSRGYVEKQEIDHTTQGDPIKQVFNIGGQIIEF